MPTPTGKPKVGERVCFQMTLQGDEPKPPIYGTVTRREDGISWCLWVLIDGRTRPTILTEAGWHMKHGHLKVV